VRNGHEDAAVARAKEGSMTNLSPENLAEATRIHAVVSEGFCPVATCGQPLDSRRACRNPVHRPMRWHACGSGWAQAFLDLPSGDPAGFHQCEPVTRGA